MKALTVYAPYAALIASGDKTIEARSWSTKYRGPLLICSAAFCPPEWKGVLPVAHALAIVDLVHCRSFTPNDHDAAQFKEPFEGFAWELENPRIIRPLPVKGRQRIYNLDIAPEIIDVHGDDLIEYWCNLGLIT